MKIPIIAGIALFCGLVFPGCASGARTALPKTAAQDYAYVMAQGRIPAEAKRFESFQIIDHQAKADGAEIPEWVNRYLTGGGREVENLPEFGDKYVFVGMSEGTNFKALSQWAAAFTPAQDFARLAASRIETRLTGAAQNATPDETYGAFFEALIKKASDAQYQGVVKEAGFWVQLLLPADEADEENEEGAEQERTEVNREVYVFLILISIDKNQLESQINAIFNAARTNITPRRDQTTAINRIGENFFAGF
jgi:hypothetical protein